MYYLKKKFSNYTSLLRFYLVFSLSLPYGRHLLKKFFRILNFSFASQQSHSQTSVYRFHCALRCSKFQFCFSISTTPVFSFLSGTIFLSDNCFLVLLLHYSTFVLLNFHFHFNFSCCNMMNAANATIKLIMRHIVNTSIFLKGTVIIYPSPA